MKRVHKVQAGFALIFISQGLVLWAGIESFRRAERGDPEWPALLIFVPGICLGIIALWLLITTLWFEHK